jgi:hypothetical protein
VIEDNRGSLANPMTPEQVQTKFRENAGLALGEARIDAIMESAEISTSLIISAP